jgi:transposase
MSQEDIFAFTIGIQKPWYVENIILDLEKNEFHIKVNFPKGSLFEYTDEETGEQGYYKAYDTSEKTWRHMNIFQYRCYIHARIPRLDLKNGKIRQVKASWEGISVGFTLLFEAFILQLAKVMPVHQISQMVGTYDNKIWNMLSIYTEMSRAKLDFSDVKKIGIDETSSRRGHDYVTQFVDLDKKKRYL